MFGRKEEEKISPAIDAKEVSLHQAAARSIRAEDVSMQQSAAQSIMADHVNVSEGAVAFTRAGEANIERGAAGILVGDRINADNSSTMFMIARNVEGNIKPVFDQKSALAFGAGIGIALFLLKLLSNLFPSKD